MGKIIDRIRAREAKVWERKVEALRNEAEQRLWTAETQLVIRPKILPDPWPMSWWRAFLHRL
ncbi:hypothetical protein [Cupriavidus campinensis]|uniref:hypothetical protein n=1 Tax=Cupriavidus campinensis TaxID=151783 RepID=UPI0024E22E38|nr:hypothetical protein [Cupriavidus campinensis]